MEIFSNNCIYQIQSLPGESNNKFINRFWHFVSQNPDINNYTEFIVKTVSVGC